MAIPTPTRRPAVAAVGRLGLWATISLVVGGVFAMHVLGAHDEGGSHWMPAADSVAMQGMPDMHAEASAPVEPADRGAPTAGSMGDRAWATVGAVFTRHAPSMGAMGGCVPYLLTAVGLILSMLLALATAPTDRMPASSSSSAWWRRGPPALPPPRLALCVLRV